MNDVSQWEAARQRLTELTRSGQIEWSSHYDLSYEQEFDDDRIVGPIYVAQYANKMIAVYEYQTKVFTDEDRWNWESGVSVEFVEFDIDGVTHEQRLRRQWRWPETPGSRTLLEAIRYQSSQADDFLSQILAESPAG